MKNWRPWKTGILAAAGVFLLGSVSTVSAQPVCPEGQFSPPGAETCLIDPTTIPKYTTPLIIPPVMPPAGRGGTNNANGAPNVYQIAVRQFQQQILPTVDASGAPTSYGKTTVWSYGSALDPRKGPKADATFNYPAYTIETRTNQIDRVLWVNDLVDDKGNYLPHLLPVRSTRPCTGPTRRGLHRWATSHRLPRTIRTPTRGRYPS